MDPEITQVIDTALSQEECEYIEFKHNNASPDLIGEYVSALSNSAALLGAPNGYLVWGVSDGRQLVGTSFRPDTAKKGNQDLKLYLHSCIKPHLNIEFMAQEHSLGHRVVILKVPGAVSEPVSFKKKRYIRVGSSKVELQSYPALERKLWQKLESRSFELSVAAEQVNSEEVLELLNWKACAKLLNAQAPDKAVALAQLLRERFINQTGDDRYSISNMTALLFANSLSDFPALARKAVRVIKYQGDDRLNAEREISGKKGYAVGFEGLIKWFEDHLPVNEHIGNALRTEVRLYPMVAVRELIANALIHQDLMVDGTSPTIEWFQNRLEITNPGAPLMPPLRMMDHPPRSRNDKVAALMRRMNLCEERGSGIDRVVHFVEAYQLPAPDFQVRGDNTTAILYAPRKFAEMSKDDRVRACYQHACLHWLKNEKMTNATLRARFSISDKNSAMVSRIIADTISQNLIKPWDAESKSKKHQSYIPFWA